MKTPVDGGTKASTRLHVILARESPLAVIFRRGPSKSVALLMWDTIRHEFQLGQWFKGRIYEHRCDLSPSGEKLIYFASNYGRDLQTWTAVSRPPFFTALLLWPGFGAWGGGGLFENERRILLNQGGSYSKLGDDFTLPKTITVKPFGDHAGAGEDEPIWGARMRRDGWKRTQQPQAKEHKLSSPVWIEFNPAAIWAKSHQRWTLQLQIHGLHERDGPWYVTEHRVLDESGAVVLDLGRSDWADWSHAGELLFARDGCLFRVRTNERKGLSEPELLIDLSGLTFEPVAPPPAALRWGGEPVEGKPLELAEESRS